MPGRQCDRGEGRHDVTFSHTQISRYLRCPRSYRYRYLDGWQEKETRAAMVFGRCFERALAALFRKRIAVQHCSRNGALFEMLPLRTKRENPGIACSTKESTCSSGSPNKIACAFEPHSKTCKSK